MAWIVSEVWYLLLGNKAYELQLAKLAYICKMLLKKIRGQE